MGFFSNLFGQKNPEAPKKELTSEMRGVFDRMYGVGGKPGIGGSNCSICGSSNPTQGLMCAKCMEQMKVTGNKSFHSCGGCGAGFLVEPNVDVYTFSMDGVARVFCACCLEHLRKQMTGGNVSMPSTPRGYDTEGQTINSNHPGRTILDKLQAREDQTMINFLIQNKSKRTGIKNPDPMLLSE